MAENVIKNMATDLDLAMDDKIRELGTMGYKLSDIVDWLSAKFPMPGATVENPNKRFEKRVTIIGKTLVGDRDTFYRTKPLQEVSFGPNATAYAEHYIEGRVNMPSNVADQFKLGQAFNVIFEAVD